MLNVTQNTPQAKRSIPTTIERTQTPHAEKITAATRQLLHFRLSARGIASAAAGEGWWSGAWPIYVDDQIEHYETGWYNPLYTADGTLLTNVTSGKRVLGWKNSDSHKSPHDTWCQYVPGMKPLFLPRSGAMNAIKRGDGKLNLCEGKADYLSLLAAGIPNVAGFFGTYWIPSDIANQLAAWGVRYLRVFVHPDEAGAKVAQRIADLLAGKIETHFLQLPTADGQKRDLNDLWQAVRFERQAYREVLTKLPEIEVKSRPIVEWKPRPVKATYLPPDKIKAYGLGVLRGVTSRLQNVTASRNNALFEAAAQLGNYVAAGALDQATVENDLTAIGCAIGLGQVEVVRTVQSGLATGMLQPADLSKLEDENKGYAKMSKKKEQLARAAARAPVHKHVEVALPTNGQPDVLDVLNSDKMTMHNEYLKRYWVNPRLSVAA